MVGNIGNAYLESYMNEKVVFTAGHKFKELDSHTLMIVKALYGLRSSGARFHEALASTLRKEGFIPSKADPDLWMCPAGSCYEYVCVYVDDLLVVMKEPSTFFQNLSKKHGYKLKGVGDPEYHLGGNFGCDSDGTLFWGAKTYIAQSLKAYECILAHYLVKRHHALLTKMTTSS